MSNTKILRGKLLKTQGLLNASVGDIVEFFYQPSGRAVAFVDDKPDRGWIGSSGINIPKEFHHRQCWYFPRTSIEVIPGTNISQIYEEA